MVENYEEALAVLRAALTGDSLTFHGDTYHFDDVPIMLRPLQQPTPPFWHPGNFMHAAEGRHEHRGRRPAADGGGAGGEVSGRMRSQRVGRWRRRRHHSVIVAPSDEEAVAIARRTWPVFSEHLTPLFRKWDIPPPNDPTLGGDVELALQVGAIVAGSPSTVAERIAAFEEGAGTDLFVGKFTMGDLTHAEVMRSIDLFATHVMHG